MRAMRIALFAATLGACGGELQVGGGASGPAAPAAAAPLPLPTAAVPPSSAPQVELREPGAAIVGGNRVAFDGVVEGLAWPALTQALARKPGDTTPVVIQVGRDVPIVHLLRAAWTFRASDVRVQSLDEKGVLYAVELKAKAKSDAGAAPPIGPARAGACHLAVFLLPTGALRIASPGGPREIGGDRPAESLAESLKAARQECAIKYIAFGAETNDVPWGRVFDVMVVVDRAKAAGDARYVLGEAIHAMPAPPVMPAPPPSSSAKP